MLSCKSALMLASPWLEAGSRGIKRACTRDMPAGVQVTLVEDSQSVQLTVEGITDTGYLLARDGAGSPFELHPDGNRCRL